MASKGKLKISKEKQPPVPVQVKKDAWYSGYVQPTIIGAILLITFIVYLPCLSDTKEFTNWDDNAYVTERPSITGLDGQHIKTMFTESVDSHYHPLTMLSLALNYHFSQLQPFGYFLTNIIFHLLNTLLVFIFLYRLSGKKFWIGAIAALFFGIHPMHVESVAWISERKDVLYCFFFLASCISYLSYIETKQIKYAIICFVLFVLSCLSKSMAAPLPVILLLIDYYSQRKFSVAAILEKIPFFAVSLLFGLVAIHTQAPLEINDLGLFTIPQRITYASYEFFMYWVRIFLPIGLSAIYPHPVVMGTGYVGWLYELCVPAVLLLIAVPAFIFYKKDTESFRLFVFGMGFFISMIFMVLRFTGVGHSIMPDRYTYVAYIGPFFIIASFIYPYIVNAKTKFLVLGLVLIASAALAFASYKRVQVWNDSGTLWTDVIAKHPYKYEQKGNVINMSLNGIEEAYAKRGTYYREHGDMEKSMADYALLVRFQSKDDKPYSLLANFYGIEGRYDSALILYGKALEMNPNNTETLYNRGITYSIMHKDTEALNDFLTELKLHPADSFNLRRQIAFEKLKVGLYEESIADCNKFLAINPIDTQMLACRGTAMLNLKKYSEAISDLTTALKLNPTLGIESFNLSVAYRQVGNKALALEAALNARKNGFPVEERYLKGLE